MTREEAIGVLEDVRDAICENIPGSHPELDELKEAVQMAVNALEERKTGKWILTEDDDYEYCTCSECGYQNGENWMIGSDIPFCAMCGADMRGET